ncbi:MAG: hypothetical protein Fur0041_00370 [Bacteroidia bacterium]
MVYDLSFSGDAAPEHLTVINGVLYFGASVTSFGYEMCSYNGTGNPGIIADIWSGSAPGYGGGNIVQFNNKVYFCGNEGSNGFELWSFDVGVGIQESKSAIDAVIYLNPTGENVFIDFGNPQDNIVIEIFNSLGQIQNTIISDHAHSVSFQVEGAPGVYFIKITTASGSKVTTLVKW